MSPVPARKRMLIVEDEFLIAVMLEDMLSELNFGVVGIASNPTRALELIASTEFDAAILDVNLDGCDSFDVAAALSERRIPFIFTTGYGSSRVLPEYAHHPVVQKPYRLEELSDALGRLW
jgi:CheY-like chemotaxis protein